MVKRPKSDEIPAERVWQICGFQFDQFRINIDTTVKTANGSQPIARKGPNTKTR